MDNVCPITVAVALAILADVTESLLIIKGGLFRFEVHLLHLVLMATPDDTDVQHFLRRLKKLLLDRHADQPLHSSSSPSARTLEHDSISRCLSILESVILPSGDENAGAVTDTLGAKKNVPHEPWVDALSIDGYQRLAGPDEFNEYLRLWGGWSAEEIICARKPTCQFDAWTRALFLAGNAYSVSQISIYKLQLLTQGYRS